MLGRKEIKAGRGNMNKEYRNGVTVSTGRKRGGGGKEKRKDI